MNKKESLITRKVEFKLDGGTLTKGWILKIKRRLFLPPIFVIEYEGVNCSFDQVELTRSKFTILGAQ